jgi:hypothetical protein
MLFNGSIDATTAHKIQKLCCISYRRFTDFFGNSGNSRVLWDFMLRIAVAPNSLFAGLCGKCWYMSISLWWLHVVGGVARDHRLITVLLPKHHRPIIRLVTVLLPKHHRPKTTRHNRNSTKTNQHPTLTPTWVTLLVLLVLVLHQRSVFISGYLFGCIAMRVRAADYQFDTWSISMLPKACTYYISRIYNSGIESENGY